jgi:predicted site-specific integrase-resolvase
LSSSIATALRFGTEYVAASLEAHGRSLMIMDNVEVDSDLVRDLTEILTSFCASLYGQRAPAHRAPRALAGAATSSSEVENSAA